MKYKKFSIAMLVISVIAGLFYGIVAEIPYRFLYNLRFPSVLLTFLYFGGLFIVVGIAVALVSKINYNQYKGTIHKKLFIASIILIFIFTLLFEGIYDLVRKNVRLSSSYDSYVFIIDESGSMYGNDPSRMRYDAIEKLLESKKDTFEYAIYAFSNQWVEVRPMAPKSDDIAWADISEIEGYGTEIYKVLNDIYGLIDDGKLDADTKTRVILLSDGDPTESYSKGEVQKMLSQYEDKGITISTVGLMNDLQWYMEMVAESTGGVYVKCTNVDKLETAIETASKGVNFYRNLLGSRTSNFLYFVLGIMRIIFVAGIGLVIALEKCAIAEKFIDTKSVMISSILGGILAGFAIELGFFLLPLIFQFMPTFINTIATAVIPTFNRIVTCVLMSFTVLRVDAMIDDANNSRQKDYFY